MQVNTDLIPTYMAVSNFGPSYSTAIAVPMAQSPMQPAMGHVYMQSSASTVSNDQQMRAMLVTVPEGVLPGAVLSVQAPDGTQVQVMITYLL